MTTSRAVDHSSDNYRGIGLGSLILKIYDWILLIVNKEQLENDINQFGFQEEASTSMCTWAVIETVDFFKRSGSPVYACLLDYRKAFDLVKHQKIVRLIIIIYLYQKYYVKWDHKRSYSFSVTKGLS